MLVKAELCHAAVMAAIHACAFPPDERWDAASIARQLAVPGIHGWVGLCPEDGDGEPGGMILCRVAADEAEILTLAVTPLARGRGIASRLMQAAVDRVVACGAVALLLEVGTMNTPARALYDRMGFVPVGRRRSYYADGGDADILRLALQPRRSTT